MLEKKQFLRATDIMEILDVSDGQAYKIIRKMNQELAAQGYFVQRGRVSREYFEDRMYHKQTI